MTWLRRDFDLRTQRAPEVPEDLIRIVGLDVGEKTHPAMILSAQLGQSLEWFCRQGHKTRQRLDYLAREIKAIDEQESAAYAQNVKRAEEINELRKKPDKTHKTSFLIHHLKKQFRESEDQRTRWKDLRDDMASARVHEAAIHFARVSKVNVSLQAYFENSGLLNFDVDAYMSEIRDSPPALRGYYDEVRGELLKHRQNKIFAARTGLDGENHTQTAAATHQPIPSELEALVAEYNSHWRDLRFAQAEFDDRNKLKQENKFRREEVEAAGERVPDDTEFDLNCLREDMRKTRNLRKAEQNLIDVRARLRQHVAISDVDSVVPVHDTPIKGIMHTALVRAAKTSTKIDNWLRESDAESFGPGPRFKC